MSDFFLYSLNFSLKFVIFKSKSCFFYEFLEQQLLVAFKVWINTEVELRRQLRCRYMQWVITTLEIMHCKWLKYDQFVQWIIEINFSLKRTIRSTDVWIRLDKGPIHPISDQIQMPQFLFPHHTRMLTTDITPLLQLIQIVFQWEDMSIDHSFMMTQCWQYRCIWFSTPVKACKIDDI